MKAKIASLTTQEYAIKRGITSSAAQAAIQSVYENKHSFPCEAVPGVTKIEKFGRFYIITADLAKITKGRAEKYFKNKA